MSPSGSEAVAAGDAYLGLREVSLEVPVFVQGDRPVRSWRQALLSATVHRPKREFRTLLSGVSFEAWPGDRIGLIGRNGAGKTTLLHVLTGAYQPSHGSYECIGQRQALINISLGFNAEATVRENVLLRGTAMGVGVRELIELTEPILEFAELTSVANDRLATLSAGQRLRLGFAISTSVQHDIMLLDEWIGAGDAEFLAKARNRMLERVEASKIMVLATHSNDLMKRVCNRGLVLDKGQVVFNGDIRDALEFYQEMIGARRAGTAAAAPPASREPVEPVPVRRALHGGLAIPFPHHLMFQNVEPGKHGAPGKHSLLIEYVDVEPHEAFDRLVAAAAGAGYAAPRFESLVPTLKAAFMHADGTRLEVSIQAQVPADQSRARGSRGRMHLVVQPAAEVPAAPAG